MGKAQRKASRVLAAFLVLSFGLVSFPVSYAAQIASLLPIPQQLVLANVGRMRGTALTINGSSANTGNSIATDSTIETGPDTTVTINLGSLGTLDLAPNTRLQLSYNDSGQVKVRLIVGCAILSQKKGDGEVTSETGESTGKTTGGGAPLDVCIPAGGNPVVNQGAAASAIASASVATAGGLFGLGTAGTIAILGGIGGATLATVLVLQDNQVESISAPAPL
ncbi:MAG TPA: hypothetical protein VJ180_02820 [Pyrinomonadaceae bacterium]|nr:hypothetical protein [Pyrinomonadaceae bacterium]